MKSILMNHPKILVVQILNIQDLKGVKHQDLKLGVNIKKIPSLFAFDMIQISLQRMIHVHQKKENKEKVLA